MTFEIPFVRVDHFVRIPVGLTDGVEGRLLVDTGIGITVVHPSLVERAGLRPVDEKQVGHRMSGQEIGIPLVHVPQLDVGGLVLANVLVGVADLGATAGEGGFDGIIGLDLLGALPLTVDPFAQVIRLAAPAPDSATSLAVPVRLNCDGLAVDLRTDLRLPDGRVIEVEIDTGSQSTILDTRFMSACHVDGHAPGVRVEEGTDQTGHPYVRHFVPINGALSLESAPELAHERPTVMFQDIELNGLIGTDFLDRYVQTYDTQNCAITLTRSAPPRR